MSRVKKGKLHDKGALFLRSDHGRATSEDGDVYELSTNFGTGVPIICSAQTGKYFVLGWEDLIAMAVEAGIDDPAPLPKEGRDGQG